MRNPIENPIGFAQRLERGSERRVELVAKGKETAAQFAASQLAAKGIVTLDPQSPTLLGRIGGAVEDYFRGLGIIAREELDALVPKRVRPYVAIPVAGVLAGVLTLACAEAAGGGGEPATPNPTQRVETTLQAEQTIAAQTTPIPEPTKTPTPELSPTSTPEELDFAPYEVYRGNLAEGGGIMLLFFPDGTLLYVDFTKTKQTSDARTISPGLFSQKKPGSFSFSLPYVASMDAELKTPKKISGRIDIWVPSPTSPSPLAGEMLTTNFTAESRGKGKQDAIREFGILYREAGGRALTVSEAQRILEQMCRCQLPSDSTGQTSADQKPSQEPPIIVNDNRSAYGGEELSPNSAQATTAINQSSVSATRAEHSRISRTIYTNGGDRNLILHQKDLSLAKQIIDKTGLGFLIKEVHTFEPLRNLPSPVRDVFKPIIPTSIVPDGYVGYDPDGVRISLNPYFGPEDVGRRIIFHELGHSVDPELNPYLKNFFSPSEVTALQGVTTKLKDAYWQHYFINENKTISFIEEYYRQEITSAVRDKFGISEASAKDLLFKSHQNADYFDKFSKEDQEFLAKVAKILETEAFATIVAEFGLDPLGSSRDFPDLARVSFELGAVLDAAVAHRK